MSAEYIGTAFLLAAIVGSGVMAESLSADAGLQLLQNALATAGALTAIILALGSVSGAHLNPAVTLADLTVGEYIAGAYYFTSSISFANPAVTVARMFSDTFAGIEPSAVGGFVVAELAGTLLAVALIRFLFPTNEQVADQVVVPHEAR